MMIQFLLNRECNWNCTYCNQGDKSKYRTKTDDELLESFRLFVDNIPAELNHMGFGFLGGEPGLWSEYLWDSIISITNENKNVHVKRIYTNGEIFSHPSFKNKNFEWNFVYHCTPEIDANKIYNKDHRIIENVIVITKNNLSKLDNFLTINNDINFKINISECSTYKEGIRDFGLEEYNTLINILKNKNNINLSTFEEILLTRNRMKNNTINHLRNICKKQKTSKHIDLNKDIIYGCCQYSEENSKELNKLNIINHFKDKLFETIECGECIIPTLFNNERKV